MLVGESLGEPNDDLCFMGREVRQRFAEMIVVRAAKLILNDDRGTVWKIAAQDVSAVEDSTT